MEPGAQSPSSSRREGEERPDPGAEDRDDSRLQRQARASCRSGVSRRTFLKVSAAGAVAAGVLTSPFVRAQTTPAAPEQTTSADIAEKTIATSCLNCATRCGTIVRVANGKAVSIRGNPLSRVSEGELCPRGLIGLQVLYDPSRIAAPLKRTNPQKGKGVDPGWISVSWVEAMNELASRLKALRDNGRPESVLMVAGLNAASDEDLIQRFAHAYGTPNLVTAAALEKAAEVTGRWMADGNEDHIAYDMENTAYILAFGAGILESEKPVARNLRMWGKIRRERPNRAGVVVVDPRFSVTASKADRWLPIVPGTDAALAMGIANVIVSEQRYDAQFIDRWTSGFEQYKNLVLSEYAPERVASITGIEAATIRQIAREFSQSKPAMAWVGRGVAAWPGGAFHSYAVFCLNALVGSIDIPGGIIYQEAPPYRDMPDVEVDDIAFRGLARPRIDLSGTAAFPTAKVVTNQVADSIISGKPYPAELAIGFNSNLNMLAPGDTRWCDALARIPYYVHVSPTVSEMAEYADLLLPSQTFMEQWAYDHSPPGSGFAEVRLKQPVVETRHEAGSIADIVFGMAASLGGTVAGSFSSIGDNGRGFVEFRTSSLLDWNTFQRDGVWNGPAYDYNQRERRIKTPSGRFEFRSGNLEASLKEKGAPTPEGSAFMPHYREPEYLGDAARYPLRLSVYQPLLALEGGNQNAPWAQDSYLVLHGVGWTTLAEINTDTARNLRIGDGDAVWVESPTGRIKARARVVEGVVPGIVSMATGQGHYAGGQWQKDVGANPNDIIGVSYDSLSGQSAFFNTRVKVYRA